jgi:DNA-binding XRE family transcriptional regulator
MASFHNMENPSDDIVIRRWREVEMLLQQASAEGVGSRKRTRKAIENGASAQTLREASGAMDGNSSGRRVVK